MSKVCAKCEKSVYPTEELKCLDKVWHKSCFKCWECGMSLNMKNYKGYDKKPYCVAHYPQTKATVVAETPELARLTQATKNQSQAKYHEEFEKNIKGTKIQVTDDPETQRLKQLNSIVSQVEYKGLKEKVTDMETKRQNVGQSDGGRPHSESCDETNAPDNWSSPYADRNVSHSTTYSSQGKVEQAATRKIGSISDYEPPAGQAAGPRSAYQPIGAASSSSRQRQEWEETVPMSNSAPFQQMVIAQQQQQQLEQQQREQQLREQQLREQQQQQQREQQLREQQIREQQQREQQLREQQQREQQMRDQQLKEQQLREQQLREQQQREQQLREQQQREQQIREQQQREQQMREQQLREQQMREQQLREQQREQQLREQQLLEQQLREQQLLEQHLRQQQLAYMNQQAQRTPAPQAYSGPLYQAMYDYDAQDDDEVGFRENDLIINVEPIDEGWMFGTVQRTGMRGMLPANYVERIK